MAPSLLVLKECLLLDKGLISRLSCVALGARLDDPFGSHPAQDIL